VAITGSLVGDRPATLVGEFPAVEAGGKVAGVGSRVGDRPAVLASEFPAVEAGGKMAGVGSRVGDRPAVLASEFPAVEAGGKMAAAGSRVGDRPAVLGVKFPTVEAGGKIAAACSHVGDRAAAFVFPVLQRRSMGKSPGEETGEGGELFPQHLGGCFRRDGIAVDGTAPDLSGGKVVGFPPALLFGQVQSLEGLRVGEKIGNSEIERGNMEEKGSELAHFTYPRLPQNKSTSCPASCKREDSAPVTDRSIPRFSHRNPSTVPAHTQRQSPSLEVPHLRFAHFSHRYST